MRELEPDLKSQLSASPFQSVPIEVIVSVGRARPAIKELLDLKLNAVLTLDSQIDDAVELYVGDRIIARDQLEEISEGPDIGKLAVRLTDILTSPLPAG